MRRLSRATAFASAFPGCAGRPGLGSAPGYAASHASAGGPVSPERPTLKMIGRQLERADHELRDSLTRAAQPYEFYEAGTPEARALLERHGATAARLPVMIDGEEVFERATI